MGDIIDYTGQGTCIGGQPHQSSKPRPADGGVVVCDMCGTVIELYKDEAGELHWRPWPKPEA